MVLVLTVLPALLVLFDRIVTDNEFERFESWRNRRRRLKKPQKMEADAE